MDTFMPLILLICASARSEPLQQAVQRRSDGGVYAGQHASGYEQIAYAALSLHAPIPVLHVLSRVPLQRPQPGQQAAHSMLQPVQHGAHSMLQPVQHGAHSMLQPVQHGAHSMLLPAYAPPYPYTTHYSYDKEPDADESTILYARPNPRGGYTYRRRPTKSRAPQRPTTSEPIIIRVHRYRVVRDR